MGAVYSDIGPSSRQEDFSVLGQTSRNAAVARNESSAYTRGADCLRRTRASLDADAGRTQRQPGEPVSTAAPFLAERLAPNPSIEPAFIALRHNGNPVTGKLLGLLIAVYAPWQYRTFYGYSLVSHVPLALGAGRGGGIRRQLHRSRRRRQAVDGGHARCSLRASHA